jgi:hypothetical protein
VILSLSHIEGNGGPYEPSFGEVVPNEDGLMCDEPKESASFWPVLDRPYFRPDWFLREQV